MPVGVVYRRRVDRDALAHFYGCGAQTRLCCGLLPIHLKRYKMCIRDRTYTEFESFMGRQEYKMIKKRLRRGLNATIENGGYIANAPYGYDKTKIGKTPSLKINEAEAKFIHMIFDLYQICLLYTSRGV